MILVKMWATQSVPSSTTRTLGMTSAISLASPKDGDIEKTKELHEALKPFDVFETEAELNYRCVYLV